MRSYTLATEFTDAASEQALIASLVQHPALYWEFCEVLPPDVFVCETSMWQQFVSTVATKQRLQIPETWQPATDPHATAHHLVDLSQRRILAAGQERVAEVLFDETKSAAEVVRLLEEETRRVQAAFREPHTGALQWAPELVPKVLEDAEARYQQRIRTGKPVMGIPTGLVQLDTVLGGLQPGFYLLGGPPGMGKTTLALHLALHASQTIPVLFVTFEHAPTSLLLKALCAQAEENPQQVQRGYANVQRLREVGMAWAPGNFQLGLIEGTSTLTVSQVHTHSISAMHRYEAEECLIIVDYLQLWAKIAGEFTSMALVRERVERLGGGLQELARQLRSPVVALSSQNRAQGNYGNGKGAVALDSLKESGDLEYMADVVLFLTAAERQATPPAHAVDLTIAKHRSGARGTVPLIFRLDIGTIREEARA